MPIYSHSRLETYSNCPFKYKLLYIDKKSLKVETIEAHLGSCVHAALEWLYKQVQMERLPVLEDMLQIYKQVWQANYADNMQIVNADFSADDYFKVGQKCLKDYYATYHPFRSGQIIGLEQLVSIQINGYKLQGYIDRLEKSPEGVYEIHDYKTSRILPSQAKVDADKQLALYQIGIKQLWPQIEQVKLVWHYLFFNEVLTSSRSPEQLEALKQEITELINQIEQATQANDFPAVESALCEWCEFQLYCPKRKHLYLVQNLKEEEKQADSGLELVDNYLKLAAKRKELKEQVEEIDAELEKIKAAIVQYADENGVDNVAGSTHMAKVKKEVKVVLPVKRGPERASLDALIKQLGFWEQVSDINQFALTKLLTEGKLSAQAAEEIKKFVSMETTAKVTFAKIKQHTEQFKLEKATGNKVQESNRAT